jgi:primosomal protein DnaI
VESIRDVLKNMPNGDLLVKAEQKLAQVLEQQVVKQWLSEQPQSSMQINAQSLKPHINKLYQLVRDSTHCAQCPGLDKCPNDFVGHYTQLQLLEGHDGAVDVAERKQPCDKQLARTQDQKLRARIRSFHIAERALSEGFSASEILALDMERAKAVQQMLKYVLQAKEQGLPARGLYVYGPFGTGKTFLLCYLLHELAKCGYSGAIVYMPDFVEDVKSMIQEPQRLKETVELLKQTDLLVFDDIGAENLSPWVRDHVFGAVLNDRMGRKPTFFTSNFELGNLLKHFSFTNREGDEEHKGQRLMERIKPYVDPVYVGGSNKRNR